MSEYRTDEETIELAKSWWRDNGTKLVTGVAVALAVVLGFRAWQDHVREQNETAADHFHQFEQTQDSTAPGVAQTRDFLYKQLRAEHAGSGYAPLAALLEAQRLAARKEFTAAAKELQWAIDNASSPHLKDVARLRLVRVQWAQGDTAAALKTLDTVDAAGFAGEINELRGDILVAKGDRSGAHAAYQAAVKADGKTPAPLLEMKRDDVAPAGADPASADPASGNLVGGKSP